MPARGDHDQRRRDVARIAADLVAAGGLAAATHRRIAEAAGCSTTVVSHYFSDKRDLVDAIYREVGERVTTRLDAAVDAAHGGEDGLPSILAALLPLDEDRARDWRLLFTFLGLAATDAELGAEQRRRATTARTRIEQTIVAGQRSGRFRADLDPEESARTVLALVLGVGMQALFDPDGWPEQRIRATVATAVADLRPV